ncbi:hypothetical protein QBC41DRAFT_349794 [Cercophora samala]|uniref:Uncharacterized protein n=1 Tax=Cercophora samala TaxID=330535 RepID=A0AA39Z6N6_9PEZI|nr:hypothetical protein QBC41DRAFT_349794 [Cercophora samala]
MHFKPTLQALFAFHLLQTTTAAPASEITPRESTDIEARGECTWGFLCGVIKNDPKSNRSLKVTNDWPKRDSGAWEWIGIGGSSKAVMKDADGFYVPSGCRATSVDDVLVWDAGKWHKINDLQEYTVKIIC